MKIEKFESTTEKTKNGRMKSVYVVHTDNKDAAIAAVKDIRKMKENYTVRNGYINRKGELFWHPECGCDRKVLAVMVGE